MIDAGLNQGGRVFKISIKDDFHHGLNVFLVLLGSEKNRKILGQKVF
jgi:hypothetical protein